MEPPAALALGAMPLPPDMLPFFLNFPLSPDGWGERQTLEGTGMEWDSLILAALASDGTRLLLLDREPDPAVLAAGDGTCLWVLWKEAEGLSRKRIPLPLAEVEGVVFLIA